MKKVKGWEEGERATKRSSVRLGWVSGWANGPRRSSSRVRFGGRARTGPVACWASTRARRPETKESDGGKEETEGGPKQSLTKNSPFLCQGTLPISGKNPFATCTWI